MVFGANAGAYNESPPEAPVWLVVLEGKFIEHVPPAPQNIPAKDVEHSQMALILDAKTGDAFESVLVSPQLPLDISTLPVLPMP